MCALIFVVVLPIGAIWALFHVENVYVRIALFLAGFVGYPKIIRSLYRSRGRRPDLTVPAEQGPLGTVRFSPDGATIVTSGCNRKVRMWDPQTGEDVGSTVPEHDSWVISAAYTADGRGLVTGTQGGLAHRWDTTTGARLSTMSAHASTVQSVAITQDQQIIATGSTDKTVRLWSFDTGEAVAELTGHEHFVVQVLFTPDGRILASGSYDGGARLWDVPSGQCRAELRGHRGPVMAIALSPDGGTLAVGGLGKVRLWDVATGTRTGTRNPGGYRRVTSLAYGRDVIAIGCLSGIIRLRATTDGRNLGFLETGSRLIQSMQFHPDGTTLAATDRDGRFHLWRGVTAG